MRDKFKRAVPPPLIMLGFLATGCALHLLMPVYLMGSYQWIRFPVGGHLMFTAGLIAVQSVHLMRSNNTPLDLSKPAALIISKGAFRFTRNPLYLSLLMVFLGMAILINSLWLLLLFPCMFFVLDRTAKKEEACLEDEFGDEYREYKKAVRRWI